MQDPYATQRLAFRLPPFVRASWVSDPARATWAPRLAELGRVFEELEWRSVGAGLRACCSLSVAPEDLPVHAGRLARAGLANLPLVLTGPDGRELTQAPALGGGARYRLIAGSLADLTRFHAAWSAGEGQLLAQMLGTPACCHRFVQELWVQHDVQDPTWAMALGSAGARREGNTLQLSCAPALNPLWRWLGVRTVPHLACSFDCAATATLAQGMLALGRASGFAQAMDWLEEILSWPAEWSALHGIAEIKTPILKLSTQTDATTRAFVVRLGGTRYPVEGARGLTHAYVLPHPPRLTSSAPFQRGLENPIAASTDAQRDHSPA